jgi:hypothetical protein
MRRNKTALELLFYPIVLSFGFSSVYFLTRAAHILEILGTISLVLLGVSWLIWVVSAWFQWVCLAVVLSSTISFGLWLWGISEEEKENRKK